MQGESLFLYTDGVTEALDASGALFGEERLRDALRAAGAASPASLCMVVRAAVAAFAEGTAQADDITVLAIRNSRNPDVPSGKTPESVSQATGKNPAGRV
jgi:serine phosphatase RsbU (regulator of sigma subunit)